MRYFISVLIGAILFSSSSSSTFAAEPEKHVVKRTKTVKRHYRRPHNSTQTTVDASGLLMGLELLGLVLDVVDEADEPDEVDDLPTYDQAYQAEGWDQQEEDDYFGEGYLRASTGMVFQQSLDQTQASGITTQLGLGIVARPRDYASGPLVGIELGMWVDNYSLDDAQALGLYGAVRVGGPWKHVQPYLGAASGFLGQWGAQARGPNGTYVDLQLGTDFRIHDVTLGVCSSFGFQLLPQDTGGDSFPEDTEDDPLEVTGYRQVLSFSVAYNF